MAGTFRSLMVCFGLGALVSGCAEPLTYADPSFSFQQGYGASEGAVPVVLSHSAWWENLEDPTLERLIALGLRDNLSLLEARERITEAQANRNALGTGGTASPSAQITARGTDTTGPEITTNARLGLSWLFDLYGARSAEREGADARIALADADRDAAQLLVIFNIATTYADLRRQQQLLTISRRELGSRNTTLALTRSLQDADQATRLDITRSQARVAEIRAQLPGREAAVTATLHELAVLSGSQLSQLPRDLVAQLNHGTGQLTPSLSPDVGIPADLLRNRPDIAVAEANYYAAVADVGVAQAGLYPQLSLSGAISLNGLAGGTHAAEYFIGPVLQLPDLPLSSARATVEAHHALARQAHASWTSTVLQAILEVETALVDYNASVAALHSARHATQLYAQTRDLTQQVVRSGEATLSDLIQAEEALATSQETLVGLQYSAAAQYILLNISLGAGHAVEGPIPTVVATAD